MSYEPTSHPPAAAEKSSGWRRAYIWGRRLLRAGLALLLVLSVAGSIYQYLGSTSDREAFQPPGLLVDLGGYSMHLDCQGTGSPTILLDAGAGGWSIHWRPIQEKLAAASRTCSFDRTGLGWSESVAGRKDGASLVDQLHDLLKSGGLTDPVVYVGHSLGANLAQIHAHLYPEDVAALILIDPGLPADMLEDWEGSEEDAAAIDSCGWTCPVAEIAARLGLVRLALRGYESKYFDVDLTEHYRAGMARPATLNTIASYLAYVPQTAYQLLAIESFGDLPLLVLYSANTRKPVDDETEDDVARWHQKTLEKMGELAGRSTRGEGPIVIPDATHSSVVLESNAVERVVAEIWRVVETVRAN